MTDVDAFRRAAERHGIDVTDPSGAWVLVDDLPRLGKLGPPPFARELSEELSTTVLALFFQSTVSTERLEQWESGKLVRELEYYFDGGGWIVDNGLVQEWEVDYFFSEGEGTGDGQSWPSNLADDVSDEDVARYEEAKARRDPSAVMDLLQGGDFERIWKHFGVDPRHPGARHLSPPSRAPRIWLGVAVLAIIGALAAGALTGF